VPVAENKTLISIIVLVYNTGPYSVAALNSIAAQGIDNMQLIIVDDASKDNSATLVQEWINAMMPQALFIKHERNRGICAGINTGMPKATGEFIAIFSDDIMLPGKLQKDIAILEAHPEAGFVYSNMILRNISAGIETMNNYTPTGTDLFHEYISGNCSISTPTVVFRKSVLDEAGPFDEELLFEDYDMFLRVLSKREGYFYDAFNTVYITNHGASIQSNKEVAFQDEFFKILKKWKHLPLYRYYVNNRHQFAFCHFAVKNKKEALKHLLPALSVFWKPRLYKNIFKFLFTRN
jgi:glycosyltransferase involved in cell wall biosynthesis